MIRATNRVGAGLAGIYGYFLLIFLLLPIVVVVPVSFGPTEILSFPPKSLSLRWYRDVLQNDNWWSSAGNSLRIAIMASAIATGAGLLVGLAHYRFERIGTPLRMLLTSAMLIPHVVLATGLFEMFLWARILGDWIGLALAHASIALPIAVILFINAFEDLDRNLWIAAETLGARFWFILRKVMVPVTWTSVLACLIVSFQMSWDEATYALFIGPTAIPTVPMRMFAELAQGTNPSVTAVASLLLAVTLILASTIGLVSLFGKLHRRNS